MSGIAGALQRIVAVARALVGDGAYDAYVASAKRRGVDVPLTRQEFYEDTLARRFDNVSRCC